VVTIDWHHCILCQFFLTKIGNHKWVTLELWNIWCCAKCLVLGFNESLVYVIGIRWHKAVAAVQNFILCKTAHTSHQRSIPPQVTTDLFTCDRISVFLANLSSLTISFDQWTVRSIRSYIMHLGSATTDCPPTDDMRRVVLLKRTWSTGAWEESHSSFDDMLIN